MAARKAKPQAPSAQPETTDAPDPRAAATPPPGAAPEQLRAADDTPVMRQFRAAKAAHPDALIFFRMGDFYELFYEDAVVAARALDLTLTSRNKNSGDAIAMAGVPHHAASNYLQRLLDQGFKVAICEQMADPKSVKGIVPREVVRVVSPGLSYDDAGLIPEQNQWLVALSAEPECAFAALDFSTGELLCAQLGDEASLWAELARFAPKEILLEPGSALTAPLERLRPRTLRRESPTEFSAALPALFAIVPEAEALQIQPARAALAAAAALVALLRAAEPQLRDLPLRLLAYDASDTLQLDESSQAHLELTCSLAGEREASLLAQLDTTRTAKGARLLRARLLAPLRKREAIEQRLDQVEALLRAPRAREALREALAHISDLERIAMKLSLRRAEPKNLGALRRSLHVLPAAADALQEAYNHLDESLRPQLDCAEDLRALLDAALADQLPAKLGDGPLLREGYDPALDSARTLASSGEQLLLDLEEKLRDSSQISTLKLRYTRVFGHYLEVTRAQLARVPSTWRRKQTVANGERYTTDELDTLSEQLAEAEAQAELRERELFEQLIAQLAVHTERLCALMQQLAEWDVAAALADVAHRHDYVRPSLDDSTELHLEQARHPVVERLVARGAFVPNTCILQSSREADRRARFWLLTGPNMAGKSTFMRQVALCVIMAQMGSFVPAKRAHIGLVDRLLTRIGASDNLARGESTFMLEMKETAHVLRRASSRSLVVLDEIGRGTSTFDGLAIAWSVAEHLHDVAQCRTLFATHYHELTALPQSHPGVANYSVSAREHQGDLVFFHTIEPGAASESYGIACAKLAGVAEPVVQRARALLRELETKSKRHKSRLPNTPQLDLFSAAVPEASEAPAAPQAAATQPAECAAERAALDVQRTTPLYALQLLAEVQASLPR